MVDHCFCKMETHPMFKNQLTERKKTTMAPATATKITTTDQNGKPTMEKRENACKCAQKCALIFSMSAFETHTIKKNDTQLRQFSNLKPHIAVPSLSHSLLFQVLMHSVRCFFDEFRGYSALT